MRPRPSEIIAGIRTVLKDTVAPAVDGDHAKARLDEVRAVLAQVDWDNAGFQLAAKADRLEAALQAAAPWLPEALPAKPAQADYRAIENHYERLASIAVTALARFREARDTDPADGAAEAAYRTLLHSL